MASQNDNRLISLAGVVSVEAWYERFSDETRDSDFFLHIKFQDGVFGADPNHPVRFKIRLKQAIVSILPEEPIVVPRKDVRRDRIEVEAKHVQERKTGKSGSIEGSAEGTLSPIGTTGKMTGKVEGKAEGSTSDTLVVTQISHSGMTIEHATDEEGHNSWSFSPVVGPHLLGQAFNETAPLMRLKHDAEISKVPPVVKVHVTCLREHIDVVELEVKEEKKSLLSKGMGEEQKLKLVEEMIKSALAENGLIFEGELDKVSKVQVADVIAAEE